MRMLNALSGLLSGTKRDQPESPLDIVEVPCGDPSCVDPAPVRIPRAFISFATEHNLRVFHGELGFVIVPGRHISDTEMEILTKKYLAMITDIPGLSEVCAKIAHDTLERERKMLANLLTAGDNFRPE